MIPTADHVTRLDVDYARVEYQVARDGIPQRVDGYPLRGRFPDGDDSLSPEQVTDAFEELGEFTVVRDEQCRGKLALRAAPAGGTESGTTLSLKATPFELTIILKPSADVEAHYEPIRRLFESLGLVPNRTRLEAETVECP